MASTTNNKGRRLRTEILEIERTTEDFSSRFSSDFEQEHPYCVLPNHYFDRQLALLAQADQVKKAAQKHVA